MARNMINHNLHFNYGKLLLFTNKLNQIVCAFNEVIKLLLHI